MKEALNFSINSVYGLHHEKGKKKVIKMSIDAIIKMIENYRFKNHKTYCLRLRSLQ